MHSGSSSTGHNISSHGSSNRNNCRRRPNGLHSSQRIFRHHRRSTPTRAVAVHHNSLDSFKLADTVHYNSQGGPQLNGVHFHTFACDAGNCADFGAESYLSGFLQTCMYTPHCIPISTLSQPFSFFLSLSPIKVSISKDCIVIHICLAFTILNISQPSPGGENGIMIPSKWL